MSGTYSCDAGGDRPAVGASRSAKSCYYAPKGSKAGLSALQLIDGGAMPLRRSKEQILTTMNGVKFLMEDGLTEVPCRATRELLRDRFGSNGDHDQDGQAFRSNRVAIEQAASDKYDAGQIEPRIDPKIIVTATDMASPLSRKI